MEGMFVSAFEALSSVPLVIRVLFMTTTVTARLVANVSRSGSSAVQEPLLTDEVVALQEIARALNRNVELLTNNWSWVKVSLFGFWGLLVIGVGTQYLTDLGRKTWLHWKSLRAPTLKEEWEPFLKDLVACAKKGAEALDRMATRIPCVERQLEACVKEVKDLRSDVEALHSVVANLEAQLRATRIADPEKEKKKQLELIDEGLRDSHPHRGDIIPDKIKGMFMTEAEAAASLTDL